MYSLKRFYMTEICNSLDITYLYAILAKILSLSENYETTMPVISLESYHGESHYKYTGIS